LGYEPDNAAFAARLFRRDYIAYIAYPPVPHRRMLAQEAAQIFERSHKIDGLSCRPARTWPPGNCCNAQCNQVEVSAH